MKILTICHEFPPVGGGGGVGAYAIAQELAKKHTVHVITSRHSGMKKTETAGGLTIHRVRVWGAVNVEATYRRSATLSFVSFVIAASLKGLALFVRNGYDIVHSHFAIPSGIVGRFVAYCTRRPHVTTIIEADIFDPRTQCIDPYRAPLIRRVISGVLNSATRTTSISTYIKNAAVAFYAPRKEITVINYGISDIITPAPVREELGLNRNDFLVASIGRLVKRKGFECLVGAMRDIENDNIKLLIIGRGPERDTLRSLARSLGVENKISFLTDERKYEYLSVSDVFALSTLHEGFGIVYLEAMYFGLPIITTNEGGQTDLITDSENGFLLPVGDRKGFADKITLLSSRQDVCRRMREKNLAKIKSFSIGSVAGKYDALFAGIVKGTHKAGCPMADATETS